MFLKYSMRTCYQQHYVLGRLSTNFLFSRVVNINLSSMRRGTNPQWGLILLLLQDTFACLVLGTLNGQVIRILQGKTFYNLIGAVLEQCAKEINCFIIGLKPFSSRICTIKNHFASFKYFKSAVSNPKKSYKFFENSNEALK